jgi:glycosyltransferase involved in cell wall biosynthesis
MHPLVSIGIPTYNRARFLKDSLRSALSQTYSNIEVVVVDNASSDDTKDVVESFGDSRVKYFRNEKNIGGPANFKRCLDLSDGEYFSWLQDDDVVFNKYVENALEVLDQTNCDFYFASCVNGESITDFQWSQIYAPPLDLDWLTGNPLVLDPNLGVPLSFFTSLGIPPVAFFRKTSLIPFQSSFLDSDLVLFSERLFFADLVCTKKTVVDPKIAGVFRMHRDQLHRVIEKDDGEKSRQLMEAAKRLSELAMLHRLDLDVFECYINTKPLSVCSQFLAPYSNLQDCPPFLQKALELIKLRMIALQPIRSLPSGENRSGAKILKHFVRELCPPVLYSSVRNLLGRSK